jgi:hypothetical protein
MEGSGYLLLGALKEPTAALWSLLQADTAQFLGEPGTQLHSCLLHWPGSWTMSRETRSKSGALKLICLR